LVTHHSLFFLLIVLRLLSLPNHALIANNELAYVQSIRSFNFYAVLLFVRLDLTAMGRCPEEGDSIELRIVYDVLL